MGVWGVLVCSLVIYLFHFYDFFVGFNFATHNFYALLVSLKLSLKTSPFLPQLHLIISVSQSVIVSVFWPFTCVCKPG